MSGSNVKQIKAVFGERERFEALALLEEMRVFFHQDQLELQDHKRWWIANYREFAGIVSRFGKICSKEQRKRLEEIADNTVSTMAYGERTRGQRLGEE